MPPKPYPPPLSPPRVNGRVRVFSTEPDNGEPVSNSSQTTAVRPKRKAREGAGLSLNHTKRARDEFGSRRVLGPIGDLGGGDGDEGGEVSMFDSLMESAARGDDRDGAAGIFGGVGGGSSSGGMDALLSHMPSMKLGNRLSTKPTKHPRPTSDPIPGFYDDPFASTPSSGGAAHGGMATALAGVIESDDEDVMEYPSSYPPRLPRRKPTRDFLADPPSDPWKSDDDEKAEAMFMDMKARSEKVWGPGRPRRKNVAEEEEGGFGDLGRVGGLGKPFARNLMGEFMKVASQERQIEKQQREDPHGFGHVQSDAWLTPSKPPTSRNLSFQPPTTPNKPVARNLLMEFLHVREPSEFSASSAGTLPDMFISSSPHTNRTLSSPHAPRIADLFGSPSMSPFGRRLGDPTPPPTPGHARHANALVGKTDLVMAGTDVPMQRQRTPSPKLRGNWDVDMDQQSDARL
ncbi:hypothetical protein HK104_009019 [Borealophlyctis nickersoniae]|nr:hypothetical protein HK104_009019 [Borealophlyctis nickersoniae]